MLVIQDPDTPPVERWQFPVRQTGFTVEAGNWNQLYENIKAHCAANSVQPPSLQEVVDFCCSHLHVKCYDSETRVPLANKLTLGIPYNPPSTCCGQRK